MGDMADMLLDGSLCETCGGFIDHETPGFPRSCCDPSHYNYIGDE